MTLTHEPEPIATSAPETVDAPPPGTRPWLTSDALLGAGIALALSVYVFVTTGGDELGPNTWAEIVLVVLGAGIGVTALFRTRGRRSLGAVTVGLFAALAALTVASIAWSVQPETSWIESNRTLSYLAAFAGAVALARLAPRRWPALVGGLAAGATLLCGYSLLVKVLPGTFDAVDTLGRLRLPFGYWNAVGLLGAMGLAPCLWAGARPQTSRLMRALSVPALAVLLTAVVLSYSRSALAVAVIGLAIWLAWVPFRLRATAVLAAGVAGGAVLTLWALATRALTADNVPLAARTSAGHTYGIVLVIALALLTGAGFALARAFERVQVPAAIRRRISRALICVAALIPVAAVVGLATSSRGFTGELSFAWKSLTNPNNGVGPGAGRLLELGNSRAFYWHQGLEVGGHALLGGVGAGGFATAQGRYSSSQRVSEHAHSYPIETFADLGLVGVAISLALLIAWVIATGRAIAWRRRIPPALSDERAGMYTLIVVVIVYGLQSLVDWTWFIPGTTVAALLSAAWLAGRGPLEEPAERTSRSLGTGALVAGVTATAAVVLLCCWAMLGPLRSDDADGAALTALAQHDTAGALANARSAADDDPLAYEPLWTMAAVYSRLGDGADALSEYRKAVSLQPSNPQTSLALGEYELTETHDWRAALANLERDQQLDHAIGDFAINCARQALRTGRLSSACSAL
jgi:O-Antigen ligase